MSKAFPRTGTPLGEGTSVSSLAAGVHVMMRNPMQMMGTASSHRGREFTSEVIGDIENANI
jgi:hypothetical protein